MGTTLRICRRIKVVRAVHGWIKLKNWRRKRLSFSAEALITDSLALIRRGKIDF